MTFTYQIIPEKQFVVEKITGVVSFNALSKALQHIWSDSRYNGSYDGIVDLGEASLNMDQAEVYKLAGMLSDIDRGPGGKMVICVSKPIETALIFLFEEKMSTSMGVSIFSTLEGACKFLNVSPDIMNYLNSDDAIQLKFDEGNNDGESVQRSSK